MNPRPPEPSALPRIIAGCALVVRLGGGGDGEVFKARREGDGRIVALKILAEGRTVAPDRLAVLRALDHPGIARVLDARAEGARWCVIREYVEGEDLRAELPRLLERPVAERIALFIQVADAVEYAHRSGVIHGDLQPGNVLCAPDGRAVIVDFPLDGGRAPALERSRDLATREARNLATAGFAAPERVDGEAAAVAADVYSLGALLFACLTGKLPFGMSPPSEVLPALGTAFDRVVLRALARDPRRRHPTAAALRRDVQLVRPPPAPEAEPTARPPGPRAVRRARPPASGPDGMVLVPAGPFTRGDDGGPEDERPARRVDLPAFLIDRYPVTNRDYLGFVRATGAKPPDHWPRPGGVPTAPRGTWDHPVTNVSWPEAAAYAAWVGKRLPTEAEWEKAARGPGGLPFPYGNAFDPARHPPAGGALAPVDAYPAGASPYGVLDLMGNKWEWCRDVYAPYGADPLAAREAAPAGDAPDPAASPQPEAPAAGAAKEGPPATPSARVIRGAIVPDDARPGRAARRAFLDPAQRHPRVGFRCARDA